MTTRLGTDILGVKLENISRIQNNRSVSDIKRLAHKNGK
jgi:hypothetical protein